MIHDKVKSISKNQRLDDESVERGVFVEYSNSATVDEKDAIESQKFQLDLTAPVKRQIDSILFDDQ